MVQLDEFLQALTVLGGGSEELTSVQSELLMHLRACFSSFAFGQVCCNMVLSKRVPAMHKLVAAQMLRHKVRGRPSHFCQSASYHTRQFSVKLAQPSF